MKAKPDESPYWRRKRLRSVARSEIILGVCIIIYWTLNITLASADRRGPGWLPFAGAALGVALIAWGARRYRANVDPHP